MTDKRYPCGDRCPGTESERGVRSARRRQEGGFVGQGYYMTHNEYVECEECSFVLLASPGTEPTPERQDQCPDCGGTEFRFPGS
ncbi:hypothetical protein JCM30237_25610 [Halolamina litorea]